MVPCHRALGKSGALTGYHWGITRKQAMLGWEAGQVGCISGIRRVGKALRRAHQLPAIMVGTLGFAHPTASRIYAARSSFEATVASALSR